MCRALLGLGPSRYARGLATRRPPQRLEEDVAQRLLELREVKPCVAWQWGRYCADEGGGDQDPLRHGESFIREFLAREAAGRLPAVRLATPAMVKRLRRFQRQGGAEATRAWHDYARTEGLGIKDPRLNAAELVQRFLDGRAGGAQGSGLGPGAVEGEPRRWGSPAVLKGLRVALVPPARRLGVPSGGEASEPQAWGPDGLPWDAAPAASYAEQLEQKVQRAVGLFLEAGAAMPERLRVYESARRHYRTRAYFDVELSAGALAYRKGAMRLRSDARCAPSLNRALKVVRDRALRSESLPANDRVGRGVHSRRVRRPTGAALRSRYLCAGGGSQFWALPRDRAVRPPCSVALARANAARNGAVGVRVLQLDSAGVAQALASDRRPATSAGAAGLVSFEEYGFCTALVDPPRWGLDGETRDLLHRFPNVVYFSCNPATQALDLRQLLTTHEVQDCALFDQFPYTGEIESGLFLTRRRAPAGKSHVESPILESKRPVDTVAE
ncbi:unnamed protein product [Prorocentrum cordatum]|uniref:Uncharacterized protein n=1 Tax=Prorocentrum cordatum TaxID=2364126 RepID=A0ABN9V153_9DINO|nr:unnamed protein product [Polarella glacialis]